MLQYDFIVLHLYNINLNLFHIYYYYVVGCTSNVLIAICCMYIVM